MHQCLETFLVLQQGVGSAVGVELVEGSLRWGLHLQWASEELLPSECGSPKGPELTSSLPLYAHPSCPTPPPLRHTSSHLLLFTLRNTHLLSAIVTAYIIQMKLTEFYVFYSFITQYYFNTKFVNVTMIFDFMFLVSDHFRGD